MNVWANLVNVRKPKMMVKSSNDLPLYKNCVDYIDPIKPKDEDKAKIKQVNNKQYNNKF